MHSIDVFLFDSIPVDRRLAIDDWMFADYRERIDADSHWTDLNRTEKNETSGLEGDVLDGQKHDHPSS